MFLPERFHQIGILHYTVLTFTCTNGSTSEETGLKRMVHFSLILFVFIRYLILVSTFKNGDGSISHVKVQLVKGWIIYMYFELLEVNCYTFHRK